MADRFETVGLIAKRGDERVASTLEQLVGLLREKSVEVLFDADTAIALPSFDLALADRQSLGARCDLVIVVAGDGTFLGAARSLVDHGVPLLGINLGRLGFLADVMPGELAATVEELLAGKYDEEERFLLETSVLRDGRSVCRVDALNEVVAHKWNIARLIEIQTLVDGRLVNSQRSDGLIVATPTGSTAYALSGGGPIVHPSLDAVVLVPICPHTLSIRPLVVRADCTIEVRVVPGDGGDAQLTCDGQTMHELAPGDRVLIRRKERRLRLIHPKGHDYFATLRAKLHWSREL